MPWYDRKLPPVSQRGGFMKHANLGFYMQNEIAPLTPTSSNETPTPSKNKKIKKPIKSSAKRINPTKQNKNQNKKAKKSKKNPINCNNFI